MRQFEDFRSPGATVLHLQNLAPQRMDAEKPAMMGIRRSKVWDGGAETRLQTQAVAGLIS